MNKKYITETNNRFKEDELLNESTSLVSVLKLADRTIYTVPFDIVRFPTGDSMYLNGTRITSPKQYGIGTKTQKFNLSIDELKSLIEICNQAINEIEAEQIKNK